MITHFPDLCSHFAPITTTKVSPITVQMVASAFLNAPELRRLSTIFGSYVILAKNVLFQLKTSVNGQLLISMWALSHLTCNSGALLFLITKDSLWYYVGLSGAFITYFIMVLRHFYVLINGFRQEMEGTPLLWVINSENSTLISMVTINLLSTARISRICSFFIYSMLNLTTFFVQRLGSQSWNKVLLPIIFQIEPSLLAVAAYSDLCALFAYAYDFCVGRGSLTSFVFFGVLLLKRLDQSAVARSCHHSIVHRLVYLTSHLSQVKSLHRALLVVESSSSVLLRNASTGSSRQDYESEYTKSRIALSVFIPVEVIKDI